MLHFQSLISISLKTFVYDFRDTALAIYDNFLDVDKMLRNLRKDSNSSERKTQRSLPPYNRERCFFCQIDNSNTIHQITLSLYGQTIERGSAGFE